MKIYKIIKDLIIFIISLLAKLPFINGVPASNKKFVIGDYYILV